MVFNGMSIHIDIASLRRLFLYANPGSKLQNFFHKNQLSSEAWYLKERFTYEERMFSGYGFVKRESLDGSDGYNWKEQEDLLKRYEGVVSKEVFARSIRRRSALEAIWGTMLYGYNRGEQLLVEERDWVSTISDGGYRVQVGMDSLGLRIDKYKPEGFPSKKGFKAGVYPARFLPIA